MCGTCGCGNAEKVSLTTWAKPTQQAAAVPLVLSSGHSHDHHQHSHDQNDHHDHTHYELSLDQQPDRLALEVSLLSRNDQLAARNAERFAQQGILALNLMSGPGAGKTALLEALLPTLMAEVPCAVIEGDQATQQDALRIRRLGVPVAQINTGKACHLEASMVQSAADTLDVQAGSLLFIENVGNLVCPAMFALGESVRIAVLSVTEGEDKPLKYPHLFRGCQVVLINKIDLLPYLDFDMDACLSYLQQVCPSASIMQVSARHPESLRDFIGWLRQYHQQAISSSCQFTD